MKNYIEPELADLVGTHWCDEKGSHRIIAKIHPQVDIFRSKIYWIRPGRSQTHTVLFISFLQWKKNASQVCERPRGVVIKDSVGSLVFIPCNPFNIYVPGSQGGYESFEEILSHCGPDSVRRWSGLSKSG